MSDQNPSDLFDSHPENSGCSNDDFEQVDVPGSTFYNQYHDNGDADGPEEAGSGAFDYDLEQDAQVSTTTSNLLEDEAEEDRYAAGASEADAYLQQPAEPLMSFDGDEFNNYSPEPEDPVQPSAPVADLESANDFASSKAADILSAIAPSAYPPAGHYAEPISSTNYDDFEFNEPEIVEKATGRDEVKHVLEDEEDDDIEDTTKETRRTFDYDLEQDAQVSTTTSNLLEDEAEEDRYAAGASEADVYLQQPAEPLISFDGDEYTNYSHEPEDPVQPSTPVADLESANDFASSTAANILSTIAPSAYPPAGHYAEPISGTSYDDYEFNEPENPEIVEKETGRDEVKHVLEGEEEDDIEETTKAALYEPVPSPIVSVEPVSTTSPLDVQRGRSSSPEEKAVDDAPKEPVCFLRGIDPREIEEEVKEENKEAVISSQPPFFKDLIYWRDVKKTGVVFGTMLVALVFLALMSVISVVAYLSLAVLAVTFSFVIYKKVMSAVQKSGDGHPFRCILEKDIGLNEDRLKSIIQTTLKNVNATAKELRHLFLIEDIVDSVKFGILLWALTYIGSWFSDLTLVIIALVLVFTLPKLYETYQVQIDNYVGLAKAQLNNYFSIIQSKVPFLKKKEKAQ